jgi:mono/diheme cytochrome c family protein
MVGAMKLTAILFLGLAACSPHPHAGDVARGKQLVDMGGCADCHTPKAFDPKLGMPVPDMTRYLSGHPEGAPDPQAQPGQTDMAVIGPTFTSFKTGFGVVYARNLTPDKDTGLGAWTEAQFIQTMRTGHRQGTGRVLLPPMPWMNLAHSSDDDLKAIFAYLHSIPAVHNAVPDPKVPAPAISAIEASYAKVPL